MERLQKTIFTQPHQVDGKTLLSYRQGHVFANNFPP